MHVLVIGAGAAGLCAARHALDLLSDHDQELRVSIIERSQEVGGIWSAATSPVYENLHTNLPKELMAFPGFPFPACKKSFVHHSEMTSYLASYANHYSLQEHIVFGKEVTRMTPRTPGDPGTAWEVDISDVMTGQIETNLADLVLLCSGVREYQPRMPVISKQFTGDQLHSSQFRSAADDKFAGRTVVLVGGGPSGLDIAMEIGQVADKVIISMGRGGIPVRVSMGDNVEKVGGIASIMDNQVMFDGEVESRMVDCMVWCTGYEKAIPYLTPECGLNVIEEGHVVDPLYMHVINISYPTMAVMHLVTGNVPFPHMDMQARFFLNLHNKRIMPTQKEMRQWLDDDKEWRKTLGILPRHRHKVVEKKLLHWGAYMDQLANQAGLEPLPRELDNMFTYCIFLILMEGLDKAREVKFRLREGSGFDVTPRFMKVNILYYALPLLRLLGRVN
eukprot:TRINITY_DN53137_c0_g1_i1.p1 TRINITY_DN53137_c0_g1~~TRINITY_DN53137_c0_g1_i1.p1  ORF type:complete len:447 (+),score=133.32 TRINITY_DN53137_c0_g1_i1:25-1365(+)